MPAMPGGGGMGGWRDGFLKHDWAVESDRAAQGGRFIPGRPCQTEAGIPASRCAHDRKICRRGTAAPPPASRSHR